MLDNQETLSRIHHCLRLICYARPHLAGLAHAVQVKLSDRVRTMGIFASGRLLVNPVFAADLGEPDLVFCLMHELMHLALRTHDRAVGSDALAFNMAHDAVINDMLVHELGCDRVPAGGIDIPDARNRSAEEILAELKADPYLRPTDGWRVEYGSGRNKDTSVPVGDVLGPDLERTWFPKSDEAEINRQTEAIRAEASRAVSLGRWVDALMQTGRGTGAGGAEQLVTTLRGLYSTPWEHALQRWVEATGPATRTYCRPSRRSAGPSDIILPGRRREGQTLHIVLDTSGSMVGYLPRVLGAIADFCAASGVEEVHLIQCDTQVTGDETVAPQSLADFKVSGLGGSDLTPAFSRLTENADVEAAIILTDGDVAYPSAPPPYAVLWVLPPDRDAARFSPGYGQVIQMRTPS